MAAIMAGSGARPTSASERKAHMAAVAARLQAEEAARRAEHRAEVRGEPLPLHEPEPEPEPQPQPEPRPAPTEAAVSDDALLLQFEADVAVDAGRHLVLAKRRAASSELAMLDRAEELVARLQAERDHLSTHLTKLQSAKDGGEAGADAAPAEPDVDANADAQAELDRMFEELVGGEEGEDAAEDDWLSLADASQVRSDMAAAAGTSPSASILSGESRPASGVSDPQPESPPQAAHAVASHATGRRSATLKVPREPEPEPEPKTRKPAKAKRGKPKPKGAKPAMDVSAYQSKRAAALAKARELKDAVELGQRKTEARTLDISGGGESAARSEEARLAWLAQKKKQQRAQRLKKAERQAQKEQEEREWQQQRQERAERQAAKAARRAKSRPGSGSSVGSSGSRPGSREGGGAGGVTTSQSLPVLVGALAAQRDALPDSTTDIAPREQLRSRRRQRRKSQGADGPGSRPASAGRAAGRSRGRGRGGGRRGRPESAKVRGEKAAVSAAEVEAATARIKKAAEEEQALQAMLVEMDGDVEALGAFEAKAEARPATPPGTPTEGEQTGETGGGALEVLALPTELAERAAEGVEGEADGG